MKYITEITTKDAHGNDAVLQRLSGKEVNKAKNLVEFNAKDSFTWEAARKNGYSINVLECTVVDSIFVKE